MIRTVIFDLGNVIVPFEFKRAYKALAPYGSLAPEKIPRRIRSTDLVTRFETGLVGPEDFVAEFSRILELRLSFQEFEEVWSSIFLAGTLIPASLLEGIRKNYRLLLLSNTNALHFPMLRRTYPLLEHFDRYILSYEVGAMKPSPRIYQEAISHAGCPAEECFFTDDIPEYVEGARQQGIDAVQFQSCDQIVGELRARGVEV